MKSNISTIIKLKERIRINPDDAEAHSLQGINYSVLRKHEEAVQEYKEVIRINQDDAEAHSLLGANYDALDDGADAIAHKLIAAKLYEKAGDVVGMAFANKSLRGFYTKYGFNPEDFGSVKILGNIPFDEVTSIKSKLDLIRSTLDSIYSEIISIKSDVSSIQTMIENKS